MLLLLSDLAARSRTPAPTFGTRTQKVRYPTSKGPWRWKGPRPPESFQICRPWLAKYFYLNCTCSEWVYSHTEDVSKLSSMVRLGRWLDHRRSRSGFPTYPAPMCKGRQVSLVGSGCTLCELGVSLMSQPISEARNVFGFSRKPRMATKSPICYFESSNFNNYQKRNLEIAFRRTRDLRARHMLSLTSLILSISQT